jgi:GDP-L-fucose synthase
MSSLESDVGASRGRLLLNSESKIYIAGHKGLVGSAIWRNLESKGFKQLLGWGSTELDLRDSKLTMDAIVEEKPDVVIMAAAKVGGIIANSTHPVEFLNENIRIQTNVFEAAHAAKVPQLLFLGSSCIYHKMSQQPLK